MDSARGARCGMDLARSTVEEQQALVEEEAYGCGANAIPLELHVSLHEIRIGATFDDWRMITIFAGPQAAGKGRK